MQAEWPSWPKVGYRGGWRDVVSCVQRWRLWRVTRIFLVSGCESRLGRSVEGPRLWDDRGSVLPELRSSTRAGCSPGRFCQLSGRCDGER